MQKIIVNGGNPLFGEVRVSGSKNAALPLIFATILTKGESVIKNVPDIGDVHVALALLSDLGARIEFSRGTLRIDTSELKYVSPREDLVSKIRASTYLFGATLGRFGIAEILELGGCNFSPRPIDYHISAAVSLGAKMVGNTLVADKLSGAVIHLPRPSVGATVNSLIMASASDGQTEIYGFAKEPHVLSVISFLRYMGADICIDEEKITVTKSSPLRPAEFTVIGDMIEAGSYIIAALITGGEIRVSGFDPSELSSFSALLSDMGFVPHEKENSIYITSAEHRPFREKNILVKAAPYPAFPTDLQPLIAPLIAKLCGGEIFDTVWQGRFGYLDSLKNFGVHSMVGDGFARIEKSRLTPGIAASPDLRGGMACLLAALSANGISEITYPEIILRGYDSLIEKLTSLGADVKLVKL